MNVRSGIGYDVHPLRFGKPLLLGGVLVPFHKGLSGHSDGDVLIHAIIDAVLGGAGLGDIGTHFPQDDHSLMDIDSKILLKRTLQLVTGTAWMVTYVDATIIAAEPVLKPFMAEMTMAISSLLGLDGGQVNLKATSTDGLGYIGAGQGIASMAIATLESTK